MQNNQHSGQQQSGNMQKPLQSSWTQPQKQNVPQHAPLNSKPTQNVKSIQKKPSAKIAFALIAGLAIGWIAAWSWLDGRTGKTDTASNKGKDGLSVLETGLSPKGSQTASVAVSNQSTNATAVVAVAPVASDAAVTVPETQQAGTTVTVTNVSSKNPVWAVVYEDNDGVIGRALGAARFTSDRPSGTIELMRTTLPNLPYFVGLVADTPDHSFALKVNAPLVGVDGKQIATVFTAQ